MNSTILYILFLFCSVNNFNFLSLSFHLSKSRRQQTKMHIVRFAESLGNLRRVCRTNLLRLVRRHVPQASQTQAAHTQGKNRILILTISSV